MKRKARIEIKVVYDDGSSVEYERSRGGVPCNVFAASVLRWFADVMVGAPNASSREPDPAMFKEGFFTKGFL